MSSANAPYPSFSGITYNKSFFASSSGGLTTAQGNALYLQKTIADTATALETFSGGITTASINNTGAALALGNNCTTISIGNAISNTTTNISGGNAGVNIYGPLNAYSGFSTGNATVSSALTTNTITGASATSVVNLFATTATQPINIGAGQSAFYSINLGSAVSNVMIQGKFFINAIMDINLDGIITLFQTFRTSTAQLFPNMTTGNLFIGTNSTSSAVRTTGTIHIGDGNSASGAIHIGNGVSATNNIFFISNGAS